VEGRDRPGRHDGRGGRGLGGERRCGQEGVDPLESPGRLGRRFVDQESIEPIARSLRIIVRWHDDLVT
jgi:hypothetical protein